MSIFSKVEQLLSPGWAPDGGDRERQVRCKERLGRLVKYYRGEAA